LTGDQKDSPFPKGTATYSGFTTTEVLRARDGRNRKDMVILKTEGRDLVYDSECPDFWTQGRFTFSDANSNKIEIQFAKKKAADRCAQKLTTFNGERID